MSGTFLIRRAVDRSGGWFMMARLAAHDDAIQGWPLAILTHLLAYPPDWEIRQAHLMKKMKIGREKLQRACRILRDRGYMRIEKVRDPKSGAWLGTRIFVYGERIFEPHAEKDELDGAEIDETIVENAVAVEGQLSAERPANAVARHAELLAVASSPEPENPTVRGEPENPAPGKSDSVRLRRSINKIDPPLNPPAHPTDAIVEPAKIENAVFWTPEIGEAWVRFFEAWHFDPDEDQERARRAFGRLDDHGRDRAIEHAPDHARSARCEGRPKGSARSYLSARKFDAWAIGEKSHPRKLVFVLEGTDAFQAWERHWQKNNNTNRRLFAVESKAHGGRRGTFRPTLFPNKREATSGADPPSDDSVSL